jgi:hypothetical protein
MKEASKNFIYKVIDKHKMKEIKEDRKFMNEAISRLTRKTIYNLVLKYITSNPEVDDKIIKYFIENEASIFVKGLLLPELASYLAHYLRNSEN